MNAFEGRIITPPGLELLQRVFKMLRSTLHTLRMNFNKVKENGIILPHMHEMNLSVKGAAENGINK